MRRRFLNAVLSCGCVLAVTALVAMLPAIVNAAIFTVDSTGDSNDTNPGDGVAEDEFGMTSLRAAIEEANALAGADTIQFDSGLQNQTIWVSPDLTTISVTDDITITGVAPSAVTIDASQMQMLDPLLSIATGVTAYISDLKFANAPDRTIINRGTLTVSACVLRGAMGGGISNIGGTLGVDSTTIYNCAAFDGGAIYTSGGTVTVSKSTLDLGHADQYGGAIYNGGSTFTITASTVSNCFSTGWAGGIYNTGLTADMEILNSTLSGNIGTSQGGAILNDSGAQLLVTYSTIANNGAESGGGVYTTNTNVTVKSTIIAGNDADPDIGEGPDVWGTFNSQGYNIVGNDQDSSGFGATGDQLNVDPKLGPLQDNGGTTFTHALLTGSPATSAGDNTGAPSTDQRGFTRIVGGTVDIGSYEVQ